MYRTHAPTYMASEEGPNTVPAQVGPSRETTSSHLLGIDSRIPSSSLQFYFMYNWYSSYADLSIPSASIPITKQKCTKPYDSFPNQKSFDSHHNSKSSIVCTNCFSTICKPIQISDPEILVYWTYQEWEDLVRLPVGDTPRPSLTSITRNRIQYVARTPLVILAVPIRE